MFEGMEQIVGEALQGAMSSRFRWLRIASTSLLIVVVLALLTISLWWPR